MEESLYIGDVMHKRVTPKPHEFRYSVFSLLLDLDNLGTLQKRYKILSYNKFNLFSFYDKDHGKRNGSPLKKWVCSHLKEKDISIENGKIYLLCFPRILGYVFNPLSIYFCLDKKGELKAIVYEVKNTFGDQLCYLHTINAPDKKRFLRHHNKKDFYVSPFISLDAEYFYKIKPPEDKFHLVIEEHEKGNPVLFAEWKGERNPLNVATLIKQFFSFPLMTFKIILGIHWEAFLLWLKGIKIYKHSPPPKKEVK